MRLPGHLTVALLAWLVLPLAAAAHGGEGPYLEVQPTQLRQAQPFALFGDDLDPHDEAELVMASFREVHRLGTVTTDAEGHLSASLSVPPGVRDGYAEIRATTTRGSSASIWVLVGDGPDLSSGLPVGDAGQPPLWADPSVVVLGALVVGAGLGLGHMLVRRTRQNPSKR